MGSAVETVLTDSRPRWPDTFAEGPEGTIQATASHIQDTMWFRPGAPPSIATEPFFAPVAGAWTSSATRPRAGAAGRSPRRRARALPRPDVETPEDGEQATIDGIIQGMTQQTGTVEEREGRAVRASHARSAARAVGIITVPGDLPPELARGPFARGATVPVAARFAQGPGETLGDRVSTHRGLSIKVFGAEGERLPGHEEPRQDFVLASGTIRRTRPRDSCATAP